MTEQIKERIYLIGDTETAGLGEFQQACEIGLIQFDPITFQPIKTWQSLIDPQIPIQAGAQEIHGISDEMVQDEPTMLEFVEHRLGGKFEQDIVLVCHNVPFDIKLLHPIGNIVDSLCTLAWSRQLVKDSTNHKLQTLREHFGIPENAAHRALDDCHVTLQLLAKLSEIAGKTFEQLLATKNQTVHTMPFGKHKGKLVMQLPKDYLDYMLALPDLETNLRKSMEKARKIK